MPEDRRGLVFPRSEKIITRAPWREIRTQHDMNTLPSNSKYAILYRAFRRTPEILEHTAYGSSTTGTKEHTVRLPPILHTSQTHDELAALPPSAPPPLTLWRTASATVPMARPAASCPKPKTRARGEDGTDRVREPLMPFVLLPAGWIASRHDQNYA